MDLDDLDGDPHLQFDRWYAEAVAAGVHAPETMALATASGNSLPSVRMVLLKGHDAQGFVFYTNRESRKAIDLADNDRAAGALYWAPQGRQIRVEGPVEQITDEESRAYFRTRPRGSQIGAWASPQSQVVGSREELHARAAETERRFEGVDDIPLPPNWGGYRIVASVIEFWQNQPSRLHDRVRYTRAGPIWRRERLGP